jgi:hypothetical protein
MKVYIFQSVKGFGKGETINAAIINYKKATGDKISLSKINYSVLVFEAEKLEDVSIDMFNWFGSNGAKLLA